MAMRLNENLDDNGEMHEINVTPFIDVMLVLLIIFMVAAPLATVDVKVNLPASSSQPQPRPEKPIYLSVKADKSMFLGNDPVTEANMINALDSMTAGKKDTTVFFRADKTVDYETMMKVMDTLHQAGYLKIGLALRVGSKIILYRNSPSCWIPLDFCNMVAAYRLAFLLSAGRSGWAC